MTRINFTIFFKCDPLSKDPETPKFSFKKFKCPLCNSLSRDKTTLRQHIKIVHLTVISEELEKSIETVFVSDKTLKRYTEDKVVHKGIDFNIH